ncbi:hypothetical protein G5I_14050 [Acromyrmex echinatior]|uniref:Uncharacterized protein n=1 Tax=Acromyrmex echinatior TaxID=103372 RepID=F4X6T1_ACREC|nr:hypothetical protein G5I_14050 [Acromyrmex echinatior]
MHTLAFASGKSSYDKRNNTRITPGGVSGAARCGVASPRVLRTSTLNTERKEIEIAATAAPTLIQDAGSPILIRGTSTTAVYNKTNSNYEAARGFRISVITNITHNQKVSSFGSSGCRRPRTSNFRTRTRAESKSVEEPLQGITPLVLTQSGSEAYLAIERIQGYNLTWKRIAAGFMYQEDGGSGRLSPSGQSMGSSIKFTLQKTRLPRHAAYPNRDLEAAVVAAAGWVERLNFGMTSWLGVISHALVANGIVMRVLAERRYELATGQQRETMSIATTVAGRGFPSL